jgi:phage baseplate assembly protein V
VIDTLKLFIGPLKTRVVNMVARAVIQSIDDSKKMQGARVEILDGELRDVERLQQYGFTSVPKEGAEAVVLRVGGKSDHTIVIACDDRTYRLKGLQDGEVAMYDATGSKIVMKSSGDIEATPSSGTVKINGKLHVTDDVTCDAKINVSGKGTFSNDVDCSGTVTGSTDVVGGGKHLKTHTHPVPGTGTTCVNGSPWTGTATSQAPS